MILIVRDTYIRRLDVRAMKFTPSTLKSLSIERLAKVVDISELFPKLRMSQSKLPTFIIKSHLPKHLFEEYLHAFLDGNVVLWTRFIIEVLNCCCIADIYNFKFQNLSVEQIAALKFYPMATFSLPYKYNCPVLAVFSYTSMKNHRNKTINICTECMTKYKLKGGVDCNKVHFLYNIDMPDLFRFAWCELCQQKPLFVWIAYSNDLHFDRKTCGVMNNLQKH